MRWRRSLTPRPEESPPGRPSVTRGAGKNPGPPQGAAPGAEAGVSTQNRGSRRGGLLPGEGVANLRQQGRVAEEAEPPDEQPVLPPVVGEGSEAQGLLAVRGAGPRPGPPRLAGEGAELLG